MSGNNQVQSLTWLRPGQTDEPFPPVDRALREPNGLLAAGGDLSLPRLLNAYRHGIFPWYEAGQPILWWSPDPRTVIYPENVRVSRSLGKTLRRGEFTVTFDQAFNEVIKGCAGPRRGVDGTWITYGMQQAFTQMHRTGYAHSVEVWREGELVGGLYGVTVGRVFFGESMFSHATDASKVALVVLCRHLQHWGYPLLDCQTPSDHMTRMGAESISRARFSSRLDQLCSVPGRPGPWEVEPGI
ncbi:leucyl/phenylalanyl-tRNA--protein transferase [Ectothiorhodospira variabilis]|uniref:leucyl/phenylalanyl-tRNA--protein transferase n=1 Tax=Ectothiorhodospira variabilis TaxID=505694 RepID=UPI001EFBFF25|nr:leucyl/phenylalanyl-tRNA--protein transferase [Ectothiorhodospira variabilis]MCG5494111.1 leucyl/phenylalanyl-tRNA--protein transferase [Ectothiorhodospira variabilis]MCG5497342.1 leucyl/phenylalanyl-tRNA--protein transferase [Ectothiorhodospira variabilis]MCG5503359.1 leucyl/phenylalanyl-tRNA--protein transferase [Ectothiorhodospira variabilis]MCG5506553.1 leucyl/phenylalanyl-tRNA--protein transferase [Ectothiorhodospira variabilis]